MIVVNKSDYLRETLVKIFVLAPLRRAVKIENSSIIPDTDNPQERLLKCMQIESTRWLKSIPTSKGYYFAGFVDGEGSFNVSMRKRDDHTIGWQVVLTFNVSQKELYILAQLKQLLGCGRLQSRKDGVYYYVVSNPRSLVERVIPFFDHFSFLSQHKKKNFNIFKQIAQMVMQKQHLNDEGLQTILKLREKLNQRRGRARKYTIKDVNTSLKENPQRLYVRPRSFRTERTMGKI